jgi:hypothetical protein
MDAANKALTAHEPTTGDMVVTGSGSVGLLSHVTSSGMAAIRFGNNAPTRCYKLHSIRRATFDEIQASPLKGVGCNQSDKHFAK